MLTPTRFLIFVILPTVSLSVGLLAQVPVAQSSSAEMEVEMDLSPIEPVAEDEVPEPSEVEEADSEVPAGETGTTPEPSASTGEEVAPSPSEAVEVELPQEAAGELVEETAEDLESAVRTATMPEVPETPPAPEVPETVDEVVATPAPAEVVEESVAEVQEAIEAESAPTVAPTTPVLEAATRPVDEASTALTPESPTAENTVAEDGDPELGESVQYISNDLGDRLVVRYEVGREDSPTRSLQLRLFDDRVYDPGSYSFVPSEVFVITGQGLTVSGLRFEVDELDRREAMIDLLERFEQDARLFSNRRNEVVGREKDWMSGGVSDLNGQLPYGTIETDFFKKPATVTFNWDFRSDRVWLSLNGLVTIDSELAFPLRNFLVNVDRYVSLRKEYASEITSTRDKIAGILSE